MSIPGSPVLWRQHHCPASAVSGFARRQALSWALEAPCINPALQGLVKKPVILFRLSTQPLPSTKTGSFQELGPGTFLR